MLFPLSLCLLSLVRTNIIVILSLHCPWLCKVTAAYIDPPLLTLDNGRNVRRAEYIKRRDYRG